MAGEKKRTKEIVTREYTINLHKALHNVTFKKRAPRAIKAVRVLLARARRGDAGSAAAAGAADFRRCTTLACSAGVSRQPRRGSPKPCAGDALTTRTGPCRRARARR
jgi:hypothetical protein